MSEPSSGPKAAAPAKPPRSPIERGIVWGVIAIGLIVIGVEASSHFPHSSAYNTLQQRIEEVRDKPMGLTKKDVEAVVGNKTPETQKLNATHTNFSADRVDVYSYKGLMKNREIWVYYGVAGRGKGEEPEVLNVLVAPAETFAEAQAKLPKPDPNAKTVAAPSMGGPGMAGPGMAGPGMGGGGGRGAGGGRGDGTGGGPGRPAAEGEKAKSEDTKSDATDAEKKPAADEKPEADKPDADKPEAEKPVEPEKKAESEPKQE